MSSTLTASSFGDKVSAKELTAVMCSMQNLTHLFPEQEAEDAIINMNEMNPWEKAIQWIKHSTSSTQKSGEYI